MNISGAKNPQLREEQAPILGLPDRIVAGTLLATALAGAAYALSTITDRGAPPGKEPVNASSLKDSHLPKIPK